MVHELMISFFKVFSSISILIIQLGNYFVYVTAQKCNLKQTTGWETRVHPPHNASENMAGRV